MEFTEAEQQILVSAWALYARGDCVVPVPEALPDCDRLADAGWLERRRVDATGAPAYRWTREAEMVLDINGLTESVRERQN
jgi:hypothetical protein